MRVILLGASNLVRALPVALETIRRAIGRAELDVYVVHGHGRSYGIRSSVLGRSLPGMLDCGVWTALESADGPVRAMLTDIGNDIGYCVGAERLAGWVEECVRRLTALSDDSRLVMALPPVESLVRLSDAQIFAARQFFFPTSPLTPADVRREIPDLERRLREIASRWGIDLVEQEDDWYGVDPIHIRRPQLPAAWARSVSSWSQAPPAPVPQPSLGRYLRLWWSFPERFRLFGLRLGRRQPAVNLPEGVRVLFY